MTVGQVVDYCETYNQIHSQADKGKDKNTVRHATQEDMANF